jgi:hypothetical protein
MTGPSELSANLAPEFNAAGCSAFRGAGGGQPADELQGAIAADYETCVPAMI